MRNGKKSTFAPVSLSGLSLHNFENLVYLAEPTHIRKEARFELFP